MINQRGQLSRSARRTAYAKAREASADPSIPTTIGRSGAGPPAVLLSEAWTSGVLPGVVSVVVPIVRSVP
ncbi:hypothetical protein ACQP60_11810 [Isoptericola variabilis]|uniref:hypothetical protein n=1 Tax=Isoptericola variabilis TaxID=139208 RepID=UPI003D26195A